MLKLKFLDCRFVTLEKKGTIFAKVFFGFFEFLEQPLLSEHCQKIICSEVYVEARSAPRPPPPYPFFCNYFFFCDHEELQTQFIEVKLIINNAPMA